MGDIADIMIDGILCEQCGVFIDNAIWHLRNCGCDPGKPSINEDHKA